MVYKFEILPPALRDFERCDPAVRRMILKKLQWFVSQPNPLVYARKLRHAKIGDVRFRVGDYRLIAIVRGRIIAVVAVGHRREVYHWS